MITKNQVREARIAMMRAAGNRWRSRRSEREANPTDSPDRQIRFVARESMRKSALFQRRAGAMPVALERIIGPTIDLVDYAPSEAARVAGRPVARIVVLRGVGMEVEAFATGFLVTPRLLMTNWHVLPSKESAVGLGANFDYERVDGGVQIGSFFEIKPDDFYYANDVLDFALVAIEAKSLEGKPAQEFRTIRLIEATGKILKGHPVNIIQHPDGRPKSYAVTDNRLIDVLEDGFLHYTTDTLPGSSGAPAFSQAWELVALHHSGVPEMRDGEIWSRHGTPWNSENMDDNDVNWVANEGARVSAIVTQLAKTRMPSAGQQALLDELLSTTIDPLESVAATGTETGPGSAGGTDIATTIARTSLMGNNVFNFTGPVTIHIHSGTETPQIISDKTGAVAAARVTAVEKVIRFDTDYDAKEGYKEDFLGGGPLRVPMPKVAANRMAEIFMDHAHPSDPFLLKYHHYSLVMNKRRRLQMWSAVNVDYTEARRDGQSRKELGTDKWIPDPRIPIKFQLTDPEFYEPAGNIDRGHIVRREDSAWGDSPDELEYSNSDTFHWTNCTPQHEVFNQENPKGYSRKGIWGEFETYIKKQITGNEDRCCILAGPVLKQNDPSANFGFGKFKYPLEFWKVVVLATGQGNSRKLQAFGFILSQSDVVKEFGIEFAPGKFARYQKKLSAISQAAGVEFDAALLAADTKSTSPDH